MCFAAWSRWRYVYRMIGCVDDTMSQEELNSYIDRIVDEIVSPNVLHADIVGKLTNLYGKAWLAKQRLALADGQWIEGKQHT